MRFTVSFHGPFHVATGVPEKGVDRPVDEKNPLPASSLKGLMRGSATDHLRLDLDVVDAVFGEDPTRKGRAGRLHGSPWWWSDAVFATGHEVTNVARVRMDDAAGTTARGFVMFGEHVWAETATFDVEQVSLVDDPPLHELVLKASALSVVSLGGQRRRGEGWVTVSVGEWSRSDTAKLLQLRRES